MPALAVQENQGRLVRRIFVRDPYPPQNHEQIVLLEYRDPDDERVVSYQRALRAPLPVNERFPLLNSESNKEKVPEVIAVHDVRREDTHLYKVVENAHKPR